MMIPMSEVPEKHPKLVLMFEKETGCHAIWGNKITGKFKKWLIQRENQAKAIVNNPYNHVPEFFDEFLKKHTYFARRRIIEDYIRNNNIPKDKYKNVKLEFCAIIRQQIKTGVLEKYSKKTYKINKDMVS